MIFEHLINISNIESSHAGRRRENEEIPGQQNNRPAVEELMERILLEISI